MLGVDKRLSPIQMASSAAHFVRFSLDPETQAAATKARIRTSKDSLQIWSMTNKTSVKQGLLGTSISDDLTVCAMSEKTGVSLVGDQIDDAGGKSSAQKIGMLGSPEIVRGRRIWDMKVSLPNLTQVIKSTKANEQARRKSKSGSTGRSMSSMF